MSDLLLFPMLLTVIFISLRLLIKSSDLLFVGIILSVFEKSSVFSEWFSVILNVFVSGARYQLLTGLSIHRPFSLDEKFRLAVNVRGVVFMYREL